MIIYAYILTEHEGKLYFKEYEIEVNRKIDANKFEKKYKLFTSTFFITNQVFVQLASNELGCQLPMTEVIGL